MPSLPTILSAGNYPCSNKEIHMKKFIITGALVASMLVPASVMASPAKDTIVTTSSVGSCTEGVASGSISVNKGIATFSVPDTQSWGVIKAFPVKLKVKDIKTLSFKSLSSAGGGMVYMNVITEQGNKIKYTPYEQIPAVPEPGVGSWYTHNPMTSGIRFTPIQDGGPTSSWAD